MELRGQYASLKLPVLCALVNSCNLEGIMVWSFKALFLKMRDGAFVFSEVNCDCHFPHILPTLVFGLYYPEIPNSKNAIGLILQPFSLCMFWVLK